MSSVISYQPRPVPPPQSSEFDWHFENELSRRLRKRFLWYCGITISLSILMTIPMLFVGRPAVRIGDSVASPRLVNQFAYASSAISLVMYVAAFVLAWVRPMRRENLLRLAMWLYVLASIPSLIGTRLIFQVAVPPGIADQFIAEKERDRERRKVIDEAGLGPERDRPLRPGGPQTRPAAATRPMSEADRNQARQLLNLIFTPGMFFAFSVPFILFFHHTFACLFIPWTLRQSLAPAVLLMILTTVIVLLDMFGGGLHWLAPAILLPVTGLMFVPGSAWCWWRFRGMRRDIRLTFESDRLRVLQLEMKSARRILESALPQPRTTGPVRVAYTYEPMRQIGGDLLFVHPPAEVQSERVSIVLLDVTGHGIAAALSVNRLIGELERLFAESPDASPTDVLDALNRYVLFTMARHDMYVTAIALRVDAAAAKVTYASAGHPTAFLRRADGTMVDMESTTCLLGIAEGELFQGDSVDLSLASGDAVVAYTDGASEARFDESRSMLGIAGVKQMIQDVAAVIPTPPEWPAEIVRRVAAFRRSPPEDDTLLVVMFRAEP